jgi:hypothetical protein
VMKIAGLISRFENRGVGNDPKSSSEHKAYQKQGDFDDGEPSHEFPDRAKASSRVSSPGRLNIRKAMQNLRSPKPTPFCSEESVGEDGDSARVESTTPEFQTCTNSDIKSNLNQRSRIPSIDETKDSDGDLLDRVNTSNDDQNMREFLITEHSNRTLVIDNKMKKSQSSTLPDTPWSSRNLGGTPRQTYDGSIKEEQDNKTEKPKASRKIPDYEAEYGTLALKDEDQSSKIKKCDDDDDSLPPEVVAMSAVSNNKTTKTKAKSSPSLLKSYSVGEASKKKESSRKLRNNSSRQINVDSGHASDKPSSRRRLSPGLLKRRWSNDKTESKQREIAVEPRETDDAEALRPPTRSFSAGNLALAKLKAKSFRDRKARSQSPADPQSSDRKLRPGRKKSESNLFGKPTEGESSASRRNNNDNTNASELCGPLRPPRRIRGRSPGNLVERTDSVTTEGKDNTGEDTSMRPTLIRLESGRGRSPGTIRRSINMTGEVSRSQSPGSLNREGAAQNGPRSPATLKMIGYSNRTKSPGRLISLSNSSAHSNGNRSQSPSASRAATDRRVQGSFRRSGHKVRARSPGILSPNIDRSKSPASKRDITFEPEPTSKGSVDRAIPPSSPFQPKSSSRLDAVEIVVSMRSTTPDKTKKTENESPKGDSISTKNLSVPRAKSPGALARRPAKNPRATQTKKAQSLFEKKSPSSIHSSPKRRLSKDDGLIRDSEKRSSFSSFQEVT